MKIPPAVSAAAASLFLFSTLAFGKDEVPVNKDVPASAKEFPPGWFPVTRMPNDATWESIRTADKEDPKVRLYLPPGVKTVRGVFICFQFHSSDPRQPGRAWDFAVVTYPWPIEYDVGVNDKRNGRYKLGHPLGNMGYLLKYLELAGQETGHPELATAPIVGWLGQNGVKLVKDLNARAPGRVIAWSDGWPKAVAEAPEITKEIPYAYAWELGATAKEREAAAAAAGDSIKDKPTPPTTMNCRATTYGFNHGIYSKYGFFVAYLDRCIKARLPDGPIDPAKPVQLRALKIEDGWASDYNPISEWVPITPVKEAKGLVEPVWLPDEYAAWVYRSFHSNKPDLKVVSPVTEYRGKGERLDCGLGYSPPSKAGAPLKIAAEVKGEYAAVEFRDGDKVLGTVKSAPYELDGVKFDKGIHTLIAVGIAADGKRTCSHPAFLYTE